MPREASLLHNKIQNDLYGYLVEIYGEDTVGTEQATGYKGAFVDVVLEDSGEYISYEIKTELSVRICIREAISQLQEYAYWPGTESAKRLVIVSQNPITTDADKYLEYLRDRFQLPIYYQQFDIEQGKLISAD